MSFIPKTKFGNCCQCSATDTSVIKVGKLTYCISCHRKNKGQQYIQKSIDRDKERREASQPLKSISLLDKARIRKLIDKGPDKIKEAEMALFWRTAEKEIAKSPYCWECKSFIPDKKRDKDNKLVATKQFYHAATAHILAKGIFDSVKSHPFNYLVLGAGCGCHDKTHTLDTFSQMRIFGEAVKRFRKFEHLITEKHKLLDEFKRLADEYEEQEFFKK